MKKGATFYTVSKDGQVVMVDTTLKGLLDRLKEYNLVAPHYNTIYTNLNVGAKMYTYEGFLFQKLTAGRNDDFIVSQANPK
jgi:hypothetical protein